jgi:hypothetical protein
LVMDPREIPKEAAGRKRQWLWSLLSAIWEVIKHELDALLERERR